MSPSAGRAQRTLQANGLQRAVGNTRTNQVLMGGTLGAAGAANGSLPRPAPGVIQRKCACGGEPGPDGECAACKAKRLGLTRKVIPTEPRGMPPTLSAAVSGTGQPIEATTRTPMERAFGTTFAGVRVHTGAGAARAARALRAEAFTRGQDIYFGAGRYRPETRDGQRLLAHELTHTVQQRGLEATTTSPAVTRPRDRFEHEADAIAGRVVGGERIGRADISRLTGASVQRYSWDEFVSDVEDVGSAAVGVAEDVGSAAWGAAEAVGGAIGEAADWVLTEAGQLALASAEALVALWGGSVRVRGLCLEVTIPSITLFDSFQKTLGESPLFGIFVPLFGGGVMIGPIPVVGMFGLLGTAQASLEAAVGPGEIRGIRVEICPLSGRATGTAQLYVAAALGGRLNLFGGVAGVGATEIPTVPPTPIIVILQGGVRGIGTVWGVGALRNTVTVGFSVGSGLSFSNVTDLMAGVLLQGDLDLYAALRLYDKIICDYAYRLGHWEAGRAWKLTIPITAGLGRGGGHVGIGPITWGRMPIGDIETVITPPPTGFQCLSWDEIKEYLCEKKLLPPFLCPDPDEKPGALKDVTALGRCKCVGDDACGGGKMYEVCYRTQKDCKKAQKDLDNFCNNNSEMKKKCTRPKCYYRHSDPRCPRDCDPGTITPLVEPQADCPTQTVTMGSAQCGRRYGAVGRYCYSGAQDWWFKERVTQGPPPRCQDGNIDQTTTPFQSASGCVNDTITNGNGPPSRVAPCSHTTFQTVFAGPTKADVERCQYSNDQVITVTVAKGSKPPRGKVITSSAGVATDCDWT